MKDALADRPVSGVHLAVLSLLLTLIAAPHMSHLSLWVMGFFFAVMLVRLAALRYPRLLPSRVVLVTLMMAGFINVLLHENLTDGRYGGVALLTVMIGLKLLEFRTRRDFYVTISLGFFLIITQFLFEQRLELMLYLGATVLGLVGLLISLNSVSPTIPWRSTLVRATWLVALAAPLAITLFVLFPRLHNPLWSLGVEQSRGVTGLSDRIRPGSIAELGRSKKIAFRVEFDGAPPPPEDRYWRGPLLWKTDGQSWLQGDWPKDRPRNGQGLPVSYQVLLEPTQQKWLFTLDVPVVGTAPDDAYLLGDFQLVVRDPIKRRRQYQMTSLVDHWDPRPLPPEQRRAALQLVEGQAPRTRQLAQRWLAEAGDHEALVDKVLDWFNREAFVYTLKPPLLGEAPVDEFLFETRRGFCEHYATAFVTLMRHAGVPARLVTGYQGGEINPHSGHLVVRQSHAHAWAEVWLENEGWLRIDPTAAVAPERVEMSIQQDSDGEGDPISFSIDDQGLWSDLIRESRWWLDTIETNWYRWVVAFSPERQRDLMERLGLDFLNGYELGAAFAVAIVLFLAIFGLWAWRQGLVRVDPLVAIFRRLAHNLGERGLPIKPGEGPRDYLERAARDFPDAAPALRQIQRRYLGLRYGRTDSPRERRRLARQVRRLHLGNAVRRHAQL